MADVRRRWRSVVHAYWHEFRIGRFHRVGVPGLDDSVLDNVVDDDHSRPMRVPRPAGIAY